MIKKINNLSELEDVHVKDKVEINGIEQRVLANTNMEVLTLEKNNKNITYRKYEITQTEQLEPTIKKTIKPKDKQYGIMKDYFSSINN